MTDQSNILTKKDLKKVLKKALFDYIIAWICLGIKYETSEGFCLYFSFIFNGELEKVTPYIKYLKNTLSNEQHKKFFIYKPSFGGYWFEWGNLSPRIKLLRIAIKRLDSISQQELDEIIK